MTSLHRAVILDQIECLNTIFSQIEKYGILLEEDVQDDYFDVKKSPEKLVQYLLTKQDSFTL